MYKIFNKTYNQVLDGDFNKVAADLIGELEAIMGYDEHSKEVSNQITKNTLLSIKNEEEVHVGELLGLLYHLDPSFKQQVEKGLTEFNESK